MAARAGEVEFLRDARPILAGHCFKCHGPDAEARKSNLRLDVRDVAIHPAKSGKIAIVPSEPEKSELVRRIFTSDEDDQMPPPSAKLPLTQQQRETLKAWIKAGAKYQTHWAFVKPAQSPLPTVKERAWPRNEIDYFVLARMEKEG
jgi:mono/diheme cytochrome c family protein